MAVERRPPRPARGEAARCHGHPTSLAPWAGSACLAAAALGLLAAVALLPGQAVALVVSCLLLVAVGREVAAPAGLLLGGNPWLLAGQLVLLEAGVLLALAPRLAGPQPPALVAANARRRNRARRPKSLGSLYALALVPFAFLGPLVATLMGEAAGLPPRHLLLTVLAASATATLAWCGLYTMALLAMGPPALLAALAVAVPLALLGATVSVVGSRRHSRTAVRA